MLIDNSLWLPGYFGFNWDALYDCLRDLSWIAYHKIVVVHESLPLLPKKDLQIYLEVLQDAMLHWSGDEQHEFEVFFSCLDKVLIEEIFLKSS